MPFIGKTPETGAFRLIDSITTSATDTYALTVQGDHYFPASARNLIVSLNGVTQAPETAYTVSGSHIVFASALTASDVIDYILVIGDAVDIGTPSDGTVGDAQLKASLDLSGKTLTFSNDQISGDAVDGGTISNFASTGIDDNATSTAITIDSIQNVGIGIAPNNHGSYKNLRVGGATSNAIIDLTNQTGADQGRIQTQTDYLQIQSGTASGIITFGTGGFGSSYERMRIDASGNLLVGKDVANDSTAGARFSNAGFMSLVRDSGRPLFIRRDTTDGDILEFSRNGTTVGSIKSVSGVVSGIVFDPRNVNSGGAGIGGTNGNSVSPMDRNGFSDADIDLGLSSIRWRDIYLSGGAYIGGTGSANYLDDYEEGTWTPVLGGDAGDPSNLTISVQYGRYTKVGNMVSVQCDFYVSSMTAGSGSIEVKGFPFTSATDNGWSNRWYSLGQPNVERLASSLSGNSLTALMRSGYTQCFVYKNNFGTLGMTPLAFGTDVTTSFLIRFSFVYPAS